MAVPPVLDQQRHWSAKSSNGRIIRSNTNFFSPWILCSSPGDDPDGLSVAWTKGMKTGESFERKPKQGVSASNPVYVGITITQPSRHPTMTMVVAKKYDVERVRGGCSDCCQCCATRRIPTSWNRSDDLLGIELEPVKVNRIQASDYSRAKGNLNEGSANNNNRLDIRGSNAGSATRAMSADALPHINRSTNHLIVRGEATTIAGEQSSRGAVGEDARDDKSNATSRVRRATM
ncbi:hypothetical protein BDV93DRAFT_611811 [Ceratobasidium sp. AG-I]|nr:hypothetical protein BDV93DRAFT_611811 [Ceratobasidium sp. AG-I]